eukprot:1106299-Rhodomonas_salina.3
MDYGFVCRTINRSIGSWVGFAAALDLMGYGFVHRTKRRTHGLWIGFAAPVDLVDYGFVYRTKPRSNRLCVGFAAAVGMLDFFCLCALIAYTLAGLLMYAPRFFSLSLVLLLIR